MQLTSNLNLKKPESTDNVNIDDLNGNADILDAEVTKLASTTEAGRMSAADKTKLNGIAAGAQVNSVSSVAGKTGAVSLAKTDVGLGNVDNVQQAPLTHVGTGGTAHAAATTAAAGFMSAMDKSKLDGIAAGANNYTHPANHPPSIITQDANNRFMTDVERTKLGGIATGAQVNRVIATQAQAEAGTDNATDMTPLRVSQAVAAASTSIATPNKIIHRDGSGRAQVSAPIVAADIARKDTVDNAIANVVRDAGAIVNNTNFNTITNVGIYKLGIISASANRPPATADYGLLEVFVSSDYLIQRYTEILSGLTYQRTRYDGAAWTAWTQSSSSGGGSDVKEISTDVLYDLPPSITPNGVDNRDYAHLDGYTLTYTQVGSVLNLYDSSGALLQTATLPASYTAYGGSNTLALTLRRVNSDVLMFWGWYGGTITTNKLAIFYFYKISTNTLYNTSGTSIIFASDSTAEYLISDAFYLNNKMYVISRTTTAIANCCTFDLNLTTFAVTNVTQYTGSFRSIAYNAGFFYLTGGGGNAVFEVATANMPTFLTNYTGFTRSLSNVWQGGTFLADSWVSGGKLYIAHPYLTRIDIASWTIDSSFGYTTNGKAGLTRHSHFIITEGSSTICGYILSDAGQDYRPSLVLSGVSSSGVPFTRRRAISRIIVSDTSSSGNPPSITFKNQNFPYTIYKKDGAKHLFIIIRELGNSSSNFFTDAFACDITDFVNEVKSL